MFALIAAGYAAVALRFIFSDGAQGHFRVRLQHCHSHALVPDRGRSREIFPLSTPSAVWDTCYGATAATWIVHAFWRHPFCRNPRADGVGCFCDRLDLRQHDDARPSADIRRWEVRRPASMALILVGQHAAALAVRHAADGMGRAASCVRVSAASWCCRPCARSRAIRSCSRSALASSGALPGTPAVADDPLELLAQAALAHGADHARHRIWFGFGWTSQALGIACVIVRAQAGWRCQPLPPILPSHVLALPPVPAGCGGPLCRDADRGQCLIFLGPSTDELTVKPSRRRGARDGQSQR